MTAPLILTWTPARLNATRRALARFLSAPSIAQALDDLDRYTALAAAMAAAGPKRTLRLELDWPPARMALVCQALTEALDILEVELADPAALATPSNHSLPDGPGETPSPGRRSHDDVAADQAQVWAASRDIADRLAASRWSAARAMTTPVTEHTRPVDPAEQLHDFPQEPIHLRWSRPQLDTVCRAMDRFPGGDLVSAARADLASYQDPHGDSSGVDLTLNWSSLTCHYVLHTLSMAVGTFTDEGDRWAPMNLHEARRDIDIARRKSTTMLRRAPGIASIGWTRDIDTTCDGDGDGRARDAVCTRRPTHIVITVNAAIDPDTDFDAPPARVMTLCADCVKIVTCQRDAGDES